MKDDGDHKYDKNNNNDENNMKDDGDPVKNKNNNVKYSKKYNKMYIKYNNNSNINNKIKTTTATTSTKVELYKKTTNQMTKAITTTKATKVTKTTANTRNDILLQHNLQPFKCNNNFKPLKKGTSVPMQSLTTT